MHGVDTAAVAWWVWPIALFAVTFALGIIAVVAGVGGGVLFVPIVASFFPFSLDFVRGAGLLLALAGTLAAGPVLLRSGMASLRLVMPLALAGSIASIAGALVGLSVPADLLQTALGVVVIGVALLIWRAKGSDRRGIEGSDPLGAAAELEGPVPRLGRRRARRLAHAPHARRARGVRRDRFSRRRVRPGRGLRQRAGAQPADGGAAQGRGRQRAGSIISIINSSAAWVYINRGAVLPLLVVPSILGVMLGSRIGARLLRPCRRTSCAGW